MRHILKLRIQAIIGALVKRHLGPRVSALIVESHGNSFAVDPEDYAVGVGRELRKAGTHGAGEIERLKPHLTSHSRALIVGAHVGTLAAPLSRLCKEVVAIEANPATYKLLTATLALNSITNVLPINVAASDKDEDIEFLLSRANSGASKRVPRIRKYMYYYDNPQKISVAAVCLDRYLEKRDFDVVVMDIEGSEYFALKGMPEILSRCKALEVEFRPHHLRYVSAVTVEQFLSVITPYFTKVTIPSRQISVSSGVALSHLTDMFNRDQMDENLIFEKD